MVVLLVLNGVIASVEETDKICGEYESCIKKDDCPSFLEKHQQFKSLPNTGSLEYSNLRRQLREAVCNKNEKAICCPKCKTSDECIDRSKCKYADEKIKLYERFKNQNKEKDAKKVIDELRGRVCEKKKRFICCPSLISERTTDNSESSKTNYLPRFGSCGLSTVPASNVKL